MKELLARWTIKAREGCGCTALSRRMDKLGPDGCEHQKEEIVQELLDSVERWRKIVEDDEAATFIEKRVPEPPRKTAELLVTWAIKQARKEQSHGVGSC